MGLSESRSSPMFSVSPPSLATKSLQIFDNEVDTNDSSTTTRRRTTTRSSTSTSMSTSTTTSKRPDSHLFFYDAAKDSVAIFTDVNTLTRKFRTRKFQSSAATSRVAVNRSHQQDHHQEEKPLSVGHPPPPPYEVTLGRTPNYESALRSLLATNDENCNYYTCNENGCHSPLFRLDHTVSSVAGRGSEVQDSNSQEPQNVLRLSTNEQRLQQYQREQLQRLIHVYNSNSPKGQEIEWVNGSLDVFHGFIRVSMNLSHPINVLAGSKPPSIYDIRHEDHDCDRTLTSFYLPRDTIKALHVTSRTTTQELITILLRKFKVADDPQKYCLYEKYCEGDNSVRGLLRRMQNHEKPLWLVLSWNQEQAWQHRRLVLQENDTGDILWDEFTYPELSNFLKILDREEQEYLKLVRTKYKKLAAKIRRAMLQFDTMDNGDQCHSEEEEEDEEEEDDSEDDYEEDDSSSI